MDKNDNPVDIKMYRVLEEKPLVVAKSEPKQTSEYPYTRSEMLEMAKELELKFAKNISTKKLYELINK